MASTTQYLCLFCSKTVHNHHQAIECDSCKGWQHHGCGKTGISRYTYARMKKGLIVVDFYCRACSSARQDDSDLEIPGPVAESTRLSPGTDFAQESVFLRKDEAGQMTSEPDANERPSSPVSMETNQVMHLPPVPLPDRLEESSVMDNTAVSNNVVEPEPEFMFIEKGTTHGKDLLVETPGYSYTVRKVTATTKFWWCSIRRDGNRCPASVSERGGKFIKGAHSHTHPSDPGCLINKQLSQQVKDTAAVDVFRSAQGVVEQHVKAVPNTQIPNIPEPDVLIRKANRFRQSQRPKDPTTGDFEVYNIYI